MMHAYLSGPMSNFPDNNFPAFFAAEEELKKLGHTVTNPANMDEPLELNFLRESLGADSDAYKKTAWRAYMRRDIVAMIQNDCTHLVALAGWENSAGSMLEIHLAMNLGLQVVDYPNFKPLFIGN